MRPKEFLEEIKWDHRSTIGFWMRVEDEVAMVLYPELNYISVPQIKGTDVDVDIQKAPESWEIV